MYTRKNFLGLMSGAALAVVAAGAAVAQEVTLKLSTFYQLARTCPLKFWTFGRTTLSATQTVVS